MDGTIPVEPGKPIPTGMRYVSRIDIDRQGADWVSGGSVVFEYDSQNRVGRSTDPNAFHYYDGTFLFSYDD